MYEQVRIRKKIQPVYQIKKVKKFKHDQQSDEENRKKFEEYNRNLDKKKKRTLLLYSEEGLKTCTYSSSGIEVFEVCLSIFDCKA